MKAINEFENGDHIYGQLLVTAVSEGVTANSKKYLNITFQDQSGTIEAKRWDYEPEDKEVFVPKKVVQVDANVILYNNHLQLKVNSGEALDNSLIDASRFVPSSPLPKEGMLKDLNNLIASIKNKDAKAIVDYLFSKHGRDYAEWPAAVRNHHNYVSGLMQHSLSMAKLADLIANYYNSSIDLEDISEDAKKKKKVNRDILVAGALLHDMGKLVELSGPLATEYTIQGKLLGHIAILQAEIREAADSLGLGDSEVAICLQHMILSHHGVPEHGSSVTPLTREAMLLSMIDDMDAKMAILDKAYADVEYGKATARIFSMDDRYFYLPLYEKDN